MILRPHKRSFAFHAFLTVCCLFLFSVNKTKAAHIVGGDVIYTFLSFNSDSTVVNYRITFTMYRDANGGGADFDNDARFGIYSGSGNDWTFVEQMININFMDKSRVDFVPDNPCIDVPDVNVEKAVYEFNVSLDVQDESYMISYQRCCRNDNINNIINSGETGAAFIIEISPEAQRSGNNSPRFNNFPPIIICSGLPLVFDHSASDAEGDQLVYEFCAPLESGGTDGATGPGDPNSCTGVRPAPNNCLPPYGEVIYQLPTYNQSAPLAGDPVVEIDPNTGLITGTPTANGLYVVGVCVREFRDGVLIGVVRRDFQFNVTTCNARVFADLEADTTLNGQNFIINSCGETDVFIENQSIQESNINGYDWTFDINGVEQKFNTRDVTVTFPGEGEYFGTMILNPGDPECSDTATIKVNLFPSIEGDFTFDFDTCVAGPVSFRDMSVTGALSLKDWTWDFEGSPGSGAITNHQFPNPGQKTASLIVTDTNNCQDTVTKDFDWFPVPPLLIIEPSNFLGCAPAEIFFNNLSTPIDDTYEIIWNFGDGSDEVDAISPTHIYEEVGAYDVSVEITSPIGCTTSDFYPNWIRIEEKPTADFTFSPDMPNTFNKEISFNDNSTNAVSWQWDFAGLGAKFDRNPTFTFPDTGMYEVILTVLHQSGCPDTARAIIDISPEVTLTFPNAFSPNNDAKNDVFRGIGVLDGVRDYQLSVWNRWGEMIFETDDPTLGWNGMIDNNGALSPNGVYVYYAKYEGPRGDTEEFKGHITLLR